MSGSRRNRVLNLNTPLQSAALPIQHTLQPSRHQAGSAVAPYQAPVVNNANPIAAVAVGAPRPMVIQYTNPYYPPSHVAVPVQTRPEYPSQMPTPTRTLPPPSPTIQRTTSHTDFGIDRLSQILVAAIAPIFTDHEKSVAEEIKKVAEQFKQVGDSNKQFVTDVKEARTETDKRLLQLTEAMQKSFQLEQAHHKTANKRIEKMEALIMAIFDRKDEASLLSRLENIQYTVGELLERLKDPGAQDFFVAPQPAQMADNIEARTFPTPSESIEERAPSPVQRIYEDKSTFCEIAEPPPERALSPMRPIYKDASSDTMSLKPEAPPIIRPEYKSVVNGPKTPSRSHRAQRAISVSSLEPSSGSERDRFYSNVARKNSSEATTFDEGSRNHTESSVDIEEVKSDQRRRRTYGCIASEEEGLGDDESMVIDVDSSGNVESHAESEPELNTMPTDDEADDDTEMGDELESDSPEPAPFGIFTSTSPVQNQSPERAVVAPRQTLFGMSSEASLTTQSQEQRSLPSPATTPSAPASPERELSPSPTDAVSCITPQQGSMQQRPVFVISSPTPSTMSERPEREASAPKPEYAGLPVPTPPTPVSAPLLNVSVTPVSDDGSELSVSRMVTVETSDHHEVPSSPAASVKEHIEESSAQATSHRTPLFMPESRSQTPPATQTEDSLWESVLESPPPSPKSLLKTPTKSQSARPTTPRSVGNPTSPTKASVTIFNTPFNKLRRVNSNRSVTSIKSSPPKTPALMRDVVVVRSGHSRHELSEPIVIHSSPIFVPSRSSSPLSIVSSGLESNNDSGSESGSDVVRVIKKKGTKKSLGSKVQSEPGMSTSTSTSTSMSGSAGPSASSGSVGPRRIDLLQKLQARKGESAALTRVRKRKAPTVEQMEPPLKRARQKASVVVAEVEREVYVKPETISAGLTSTRGRGKGKGKGKEREGEDERGYKLPNNVKLTPVKGEKQLRRRAPPPGVKWPQKNMSGDKKFDHQFIECEKCYTWYHYGCIGIIDLNDPIIRGDKVFNCPPCSGGGANPMLPSKNIVCARPDCDGEAKRDDEFFMTAIIGRHTKVSSGTGRKYMWLVKWDGYPISDCTWEEEEGMTDPQSFIQDFVRRAIGQGNDPDEDPYSTILLREAVAGGWKDPNA